MVAEAEQPNILKKIILEGSARLGQLRERDPVVRGLQELENIDWQKRLAKINFSGNMEQGIQLMQEFTKSEIDMIRALQKRNMLPRDYRVPKIYFQNPDPDDYFTATCETEIRLRRGVIGKIFQKLIVNPDALKGVSLVRPDGLIYSVSSDGKALRAKNGMLLTTGRPKDHMYIMGTEETAHSIREWREVQKRGQFTPNMNTDAIGTFDYDADPDEYHGLGWKIRQVMDRTDLPEDIKTAVLESLQQRMKEAISYRDAHREQYGLSPKKEKSTPIAARDRLKMIAGQ